MIEPENNLFRRTSKLICSIPGIRSLEYPRHKNVIFEEERVEHELFFKLGVVGFLKDRGFKIAHRRSFMESVLIHATL